MPKLSDLLGISPLPPTREDISNKFYFEFGRFVCAFADVERIVRELFHKVSGLKKNAARRIIASRDLKPAIDLTKALANLLPNKKLSAENKEEIEKCFWQISQMTELRNTLIHGGAEIEESGVIRSANRNKATTEETIKEIELEIDDLVKARQDLLVIYLRLSYLVYRHQSLRKNIKQLRRMPWLYKALPAKNQMGRLLADAIKRYPKPPSSAENS